MVETTFSFRAAAPADAYALAELAIMGGDGMYEFLLEDMAPKEMLAGLMARSIGQDSGAYSWKNCHVAVERGAVVGMVHAFPAEMLREEQPDGLPADRVQVLDPIDRIQDWESFLVNSIAVRSFARNQGAGSKLLRRALEQAREAGFSRVTANIWEDNGVARALFEKLGFQQSRHVDVPTSPGLSHTGGSLLMTLVMGTADNT